MKNDFAKKTGYDDLLTKLMLRLLILVNWLEKLTVTQKLATLKRKYLIIIMINILLVKNITS